MNDDERTKMCGAYPIYPNVTRMELLVFDRYFSLFLFITGVAYIITSLVRFLYYKKVYMRMKKRNTMLQLITSMGVLIQFLGGTLYIAEPYVCWVNKILLVLVVPVTALSYAIRLLDYFNRYVLAQLLLDSLKEPELNDEKFAQTRSDALHLAWKLLTKGHALYPQKRKPIAGAPPTAAQGASSGTGTSNTPATIVISAVPMDAELLGNQGVRDATAPSFDFSKPNIEKTATTGASSSSATARTGMKSSLSATSSRQNETEKTIRLLKFLSSNKMKFIVFLILLLPTIIVLIYEHSTVPYLKPIAGCYECFLSTNQTLTIGGMGFIVILLCSLFAYRVRKFPDPFGVLRETKLVLIYGATVGLIGFACHSFIYDEQLIYFSFGWIVHIAFFNVQFISTDLQIYICKRDKAETIGNAFQNRKRNKKLSNLGDSEVKKKPPTGRNEILEWGTDFTPSGLESISTLENVELTSPSALKIVLDDREERELFEKHLVGEFAVENLIMYLECEKYQRGFFDMNENTRKARARNMIDKFVIDGAVMQVNISDSLRSTLIREIGKANVNVDIELFRETKNELFGLLFGSYLRYISSTLFKQSHPDIKGIMTFST